VSQSLNVRFLNSSLVRYGRTDHAGRTWVIWDQINSVARLLSLRHFVAQHSEFVTNLVVCLLVLAVHTNAETV